MKAAGNVFVNIDDGGKGKRGAKRVIHSNERFPDLRALADYVHGKGLKLGADSSPGPKTCDEDEGSYGHELQGAQTYAAWDVDCLK
jgi:alpha-galactosidase